MIECYNPRVDVQMDGIVTKGVQGNPLVVRLLDGETIKRSGDFVESSPFVVSVFGRSGEVSAEDSDYDASQIDFLNSSSGLLASNLQDALDQILINGCYETGKVSGWMDHFDYSSPHNVWTRSTSGTGAALTVTSGDNGAGVSYGFLYFQTGTTTTGYASIMRASSAVSLSGLAKHISKWRVLVPVLPDATDDFRAVFGMGDQAVSYTQVDGAYFLVDRSVSTTNWCTVTSQNSSRTINATSVAISTSNYQLLEVVVSSGGADVKFYIDGVLTNTHSTNIPANSTSRMTSTGYGGVFKSAGTTNRTINADWSGYKMIRDSAIAA